jgi:hypothetical protein
MRSIPREDVPVVIEDNGVQVRLRDEDGLSVGFVRLPAGAHLRRATKGLPHDLCPCPHWGYMIKRRVRMHTLDSEYVDFSPTEDFAPVIEHITSGAESSYRRRRARSVREVAARSRSSAKTFTRRRCRPVRCHR